MIHFILNCNHMALVSGNIKKMCTQGFDYILKTKGLRTGSLLYGFGADIVTIEQ